MDPLCKRVCPAEHSELSAPPGGRDAADWGRGGHSPSSPALVTQAGGGARPAAGWFRHGPGWRAGAGPRVGCRCPPPLLLLWLERTGVSFRPQALASRAPEAQGRPRSSACLSWASGPAALPRPRQSP